MIKKIVQGRFESKNGYALVELEYKDVFSIIMIRAIEEGRGHGTKLVIELEEYAKQNHFNEIEFIAVGNPFLARILQKRQYQSITEFKNIAGCEVDVFYKAFA